MSDGSASGWIYYIDESYDAGLFCLSALGLKLGTWRTAFEVVKALSPTTQRSGGRAAASRNPCPRLNARPRKARAENHWKVAKIQNFL
jgi:hypothetical protein